jgi:hypothetical protein
MLFKGRETKTQWAPKKFDCCLRNALIKLESYSLLISNSVYTENAASIWRRTCSFFEERHAARCGPLQFSRRDVFVAQHFG